jgi:hypothetical protein
MNKARFVFIAILLLSVLGCGGGHGRSAHRAVFLDYLDALEQRDYSALHRIILPDDIRRWEATAPGLLRELVASGELAHPLDFSKIEKRKVEIEEFAEDSPNHYRIIFLLPRRNEQPIRYHMSVVDIGARSFIRLPIPEKEK